MLPSNITANLDYLASIGVLDYDAAADIAGTRPRYVGHPQYYVDPTVMTPMDSFTYSNSSKLGAGMGVGNNSLIGMPIASILKLAAGLSGVYLGYNFLKGISRGFKSFSIKNWFSGGKKSVDEAGKEIGKRGKKAAESIKRSWKDFFKRSKKAAEELGEGLGDAGRRGGEVLHDYLAETTEAIKRPWYKRAGRSISNGFSKFTKLFRHTPKFRL